MSIHQETLPHPPSSAPAARSPHYPISHSVWLRLLLCACAAAALIGLLASLKAGVAIGLAALLILAPLRAPTETALVLLATAWLPLENLAGSQRDLLAGLGGVNLSGVRLVAGSTGLIIALIVFRAELRRLVIPRWARLGLILYGVTLGWMALTILWTPHPVDGLRGLTKLAFPIVLATAVVCDPRRRSPRALAIDLLRVTAIAGVLAVGVGFWHGIAVSDLSLQGRTWRWTGSSNYAFYVALVSILALALAEHRIVSRGWLAFAVFGAIQVTMVLQRMAVAALGIAVSGMTAIAGTRRILAPLGVIAAATLLLSFPPLVDRNLFVDRNLYSDVETPSPQLSTISDDEEASGLAEWVGDLASSVQLQGRDALWSRALTEMEGTDYLHGKGLHSFWNTSLDKTSQGRVPLHAQQLHGEYIRFFYEAGIVGLVFVICAFGALLVGLVGRSVRTHARTFERASAHAAVGALSFYLITAVTDNTFDYYLTGAFVWTLVAIAIAATAEDRPEPER